ncbi:leucyl aminopeptidase [Novosphingobium sp. Gsoil 351]|uniref:leucyl aminopeptidase n=1 Tax=Novosphingobium sp. Gsoil 351 TaxID=2675225 RepID=UPI0012B4D2F4|nr:leucyl aminopeptidase [Novosphingobium sp. Gsoil 351]QGN53695.1 leucyl aminopeptidase [Novosphingobium sp. Gsoil 351]
MKVSFAAQGAAAPRLVVQVVEQDKLPAGLDASVADAARASRFAGKLGQVFESFAGGGGELKRNVLVGIGDPAADGRLAAFERAGAAVTAKYLTSGETAVAYDLGASGASAEEAAALILGTVLRGWRHDVYRTRLTDDHKPTLAEVTLIGAPAGAEAAWASESAVAEGVAFTRELVTEPANIIYPESFVERCQKRFAGLGLEITVLDKAAMTALGMGALLGVGQGSVRDSRILAMRWKGAQAAKPTALVGKGVTFDTGGISIKPAAGMEDMKWDMGGAGAVAGTMLALAMRKAKADVVGICGLVENMPDGAAQRPGDVVTSMSGQTIEVINTDAEGRLVLCDAITWTQKEFSPATIVDLATLTGAIMISLGSEHAGLFSNDDALAEALLSAGKASGDKMWRFPLGPAYDKLIDSPIADMKNVGPRFGGSITAAQFIQRFVDKGVAWAHCDIAGMVWADKPGATWDKGATGFGVRLLDRFVRDTLEK